MTAQVNVVAPSSQPNPRTSGLSPVKLGRRIGSALFWLLVVFVASSATYSIVVQVFPSLATQPAPSEARARCGRQIPELRDELLGRAREIPGPEGEAGIKAWFAAWDQRFHALGSHCGELEQTRVELRRLRDSIHAMLRRFERRETPRLERIRRAIDDHSHSLHERQSS